MIDLKTPECIKSLAKALLNLDSKTELTEKLFLDISVDWSTYLNLSEQLNENKKVIGITLNKNTFGMTSKIKETRKFLVDNGFIETVISLPPNLLDNTQVPITLIILSRNNQYIRFINAEKKSYLLNHKNILNEDCISSIVSACITDSEISCSISSLEVINNEYNLSPKIYIKPIVKNGIELGTLCKKVTCGLQIPLKQLNEITSNTPTKYQYLQIKNIKYGTVGNSLPYLSEIQEDYLDYQIKNHYIIFSKLGSPLTVKLAEIPTEKIVIAVGHLYILELDEEKVNPYYVRDYFESEKGQEALKSCAMGLTISHLNLERLKQLQIPMIPLEEQNRLVKEMINLI